MSPLRLPSPAAPVGSVEAEAVPLRIYQFCKEERLTVANRSGRRRPRLPGAPIASRRIKTCAGRWTAGLRDGHAGRRLTLPYPDLVDDFTRECPGAWSSTPQALRYAWCVNSAWSL